KELTMEGGAVHDPAEHRVETTPVGPESRPETPEPTAGMRVVTDHEFSVPEAQLLRDAFGDSILRRIKKEWNLAAGVYPARPEDRSILLEVLWEAVREQLAEAKR